MGVKLLRREEQVNLGSVVTGLAVKQVLFTPNDDPLSSQFNPSVGDSPRELAKYLKACQTRQFKQTILAIQPSETILRRNIKLLLKTYDPLLVKRAIKYASLRCHYVYSTRMIKFYCERIPQFIK